MLSSETRNALKIPAWPFLIANHEAGRVDYRALVAPDFLCEQQCSQILTALPFPEESHLPFRCSIAYRADGRTLYHTVAVFRLLEFPGSGQGGRRVQVLSGLLLASGDEAVCLPYSALERAFTLYADDYKAFCEESSPTTFPIVASWPLSVERALNDPATLLPSCDATRLRPKPLPTRPAVPCAEEAHSIDRSELRQLLGEESFFTRLKGLFRVQ